jgi:hypothetical protein
MHQSPEDYCVRSAVIHRFPSTLIHIQLIEYYYTSGRSRVKGGGGIVPAHPAGEWTVYPRIPAKMETDLIPSSPPPMVMDVGHLRRSAG